MFAPASAASDLAFEVMDAARGGRDASRGGADVQIERMAAALGLFVCLEALIVARVSLQMYI